MTREAILDKLLEFAGPKGPDMGNIDPGKSVFDIVWEEQEEDACRIRHWVDTLPMGSLGIVIDIFMNPPPLQSEQPSFVYDMIVNSLPWVFTIVFAQFKIRDNDEFKQQYEPYLRYEKMRQKLKTVDETVEEFIRKDAEGADNR